MTDRSTLVVDALGVSVVIESTAADAAAVSAAWSGAVAPRSADTADRFTLEQPVDAVDPLDLAHLSTTVTLAAIDARRGELLMLHACGLAHSDGAVAAFVAASGTGKTTLARVLGQHLGYVSDETVGITPDGTVLPYRKPLSIIRDAHVPKVQESPGELGLGELPTAPLRIASVTLIERDQNHGAPTIERMRTIDAIAAIVPQTSYLTDFVDESGSPDGLGRLAALGDIVGGFRRVRYREADDLVAHIDEFFEPLEPLDDPETLAVGVERFSDDGLRNDGDDNLDNLDNESVDTLWRRSPGTEWIDDGDQVATFLQGMFRSLDGVGAALWRALSDPANLDHLTSAVVAELGPAPDGDASSLVAAAVKQLSEAGLVTRRSNTV